MKETKTINIRPTKDYAGIIPKVKKLAEKKKWSLNKFILETLNDLVKKNGL